MTRSIDEDLLGLLAGGASWTADSLAQELGVSLRTVRRSIARLRNEHVVLDTEPGPGGGIRLGHRSSLPHLRLKADESVDLLLALALAETLTLPLLGNNLTSLRRRLSAAFHPDERRAVASLRQRILIGAQASEAVRSTWQQPDAKVTASLQEAFVTLQQVAFHYVDGQGTATRRVAEPQYLLLNHPAWYLLSYDLERQAGRMFRIDRISWVEVLAEPFRPRSSAALAEDLDRWFNPL